MTEPDEDEPSLITVFVGEWQHAPWAAAAQTCRQLTHIQRSISVCSFHVKSYSITSFQPQLPEPFGWQKVALIDPSFMPCRSWWYDVLISLCPMDTKSFHLLLKRICIQQGERGRRGRSKQCQRGTPGMPGLRGEMVWIITFLLEFKKKWMVFEPLLG